MGFRLYLLASVAVCILLVPARGQEKPLARDFVVGAAQQYRVRLVIGSELRGELPVRQENKAYLRPFTRSASRRLDWVATRRLTAVGSDGTADIEEALTNFEAPSAGGGIAVDDEGSERLDKAISESLLRWGEAGKLVLHYRETRQGELVDLKPDGVPNLGEAVPPLLTLWLLRALRPTTALPERPIRFGDRWQEPRVVRLAGWTDLHGSESGEWLEALQATEPAARLLLVQQILGTVVAGPEKPPEGTAQARFHGESLATISFRDGRVLAATRSGTREISWTLKSTAGPSAPPQFDARLSAQVEIEECNGPCSSNSSDRPALRRRR